MYEAAFRSIDDSLRKDAGCSSELDYVEQTSWILFLKYLADFEAEKRDEAELDGGTYTPLLRGDFAWDAWAAPKKPDGSLDINAAMTGPDLLTFVNDQLWPHLESFKQQAESPKTLTYKIGEIFGELRNRIQSGYILRDVIETVDTLNFLSNDDKHELSSLYEDKIKSMGNAGRIKYLIRNKG